MKNKKISFGLILFFSIFFGFIQYSKVPCEDYIQASATVGETYLIPSGEAVGVKMFTDGLLVVYVSDVVDKSGKHYSPAKMAGLKETDRILSVDGIELGTNEELSDYINYVKRPVLLEVARDEEIFKTQITPIISNDGYYRIGIWVRDSTAGIGTLTFYNPKDNTFAALGHAICDADTGVILKVSEGDLVGCDILSVKRGEHGVPGELSGQFKNKNFGKILKNNEFGIFGEIKNSELYSNEKVMLAANRFQIKQGPAHILCDIDGNGVKKYDIEITDVSKDSKVNNKGLIIKITDKVLLEKTGGIVQGMSGSPIIQNDMIVGAVTHVFINDPTRGYGIFIENMLGFHNA